MDFDGAREAFQAIDKITPANLRPEVLLQVDIFRAYFLWWWKRDVKSSLPMVDALLSEARSYGSSEFLVMTLHLAGEVFETSGQLDRALPMFEEAADSSRLIEDPYIAFTTHYSLSYLCATLSNGKKAAEIFKELKRLEEDAGFSSSSIYVTLLEARIHRVNGELRRAEPGFLEAREGFKGLGLDIYVALTSLELALLYLDLAEPHQAFSMAIGSIDCISRYSGHKEAMTALAVLQEASRTAIINKSMLKRALRHVELVRKDPTSAASAR
jgi:tetratricopeptide (TPR) repeat protein